MSQHRNFAVSLRWNVTNANVEREATHDSKEASRPEKSSISLKI